MARDGCESRRYRTRPRHMAVLNGPSCCTDPSLGIESLELCDSQMSIWVELRLGEMDLLPAAVEIPAPVKTTMRRASPLLMCSATASKLLSWRVSGGPWESTRVDSSWPILRASQRGTRGPEGLWRWRCFRPILMDFSDLLLQRWRRSCF